MKISNKDGIMINKVFKDFEKFLKTGEPDRDNYFRIDYGLCHNIFDLIYNNTDDADLYCLIHHIKTKLFESWEYFSGNPSYPIPFRNEKPQSEEILQFIEEGVGLSARGAYQNSDNKYDKTTGYGQLRLDLYQHIKDNIFDVISGLSGYEN